MSAFPDTVGVPPVRLRGPVLASLLGKAAEAATLLALAVVVPRVLGPVDYGRFAVALTVVAIGSVAMTLGGATLLGRFVPAAAPADRAPLARTLTLRLARNRAAACAVLAVVAALLVAWDPARFPPLPTACVVIALALNVAATLALQADLGLGRTGPWCARHAMQNAVLVAAAVVLYGVAGLDGAVAAIVVAAGAAFGLGAVTVAPVLCRRAPVSLPAGALRFGWLQVLSGALAQLTQRGGVLVVALLGVSAVQTGFAALALGVALAATYAVMQVFTVSLPTLAGPAPSVAPGTDPALSVGPGTDPAADHDRAIGSGPAEAAARRVAGGLLAAVLPVLAVAVGLLDVAVPFVFGAGYAGAAAAFVPALALVVLAPVNALAIAAAALRLRPGVSLGAALAGAVAFGAVAIPAVPAWGALGATWAALAGAAVSASVSVGLLPGAVGVRLTVASATGAILVTAVGMLP